MAISDELNRIIQAKSDIRTALQNKGVIIGNSSLLNEYPAEINKIDTSTLVDVIERDITKVNIPNNVDSIGKGVFAQCWKLQEVDFQDNNDIYEIPDEAFYNCASLQTINIPNSVTKIGLRSFKNCLSLTSVRIPSNVTKIDKDAFDGCYYLTRVICDAVNPPVIYSNTFSLDIRSNAKLYVPENSISLYQNANYWSDFYSIEAIPIITFQDNETKRICVLNFDKNGDGEIDKFEIEDVSTLGDAFKNSSIEYFNELEFFTGIINIDVYTFTGCNSLKEVTFSEKLKNFVGDRSWDGPRNNIKYTFKSICPPQPSNRFLGKIGSYTIYVPEKSINAYKTYLTNSTTKIQAIPNSTPENFDSSIQFTDSSLFTKLISLYDSNENGELSYREAAEANIGNVALLNDVDSNPISFDEYKYFLGSTSSFSAKDTYKTIEKITFPDTIINIGQTAFRNCSFNCPIILPDGVSNILSQAFNIHKGEIVLLSRNIPNLSNDYDNLGMSKSYDGNNPLYVHNDVVDLFKNTTGLHKIGNYADRIKALADITYDSSTLTVQALGRNNLNMYIDASLCNSSTYTFTRQSEDVYHRIVVDSIDPSLGLLDSYSLVVFVERAESQDTGGEEPEEPENEQLDPPTITINPDRNVYIAEITNTDSNANTIMYKVDDGEFAQYLDYISNLTTGQTVYAYAVDSTGTYANSDTVSATVGE